MPSPDSVPHSPGFDEMLRLWKGVDNLPQQYLHPVCIPLYGHQKLFQAPRWGCALLQATILRYIETWQCLRRMRKPSWQQQVQLSVLCKTWGTYVEVAHGAHFLTVPLYIIGLTGYLALKTAISNESDIVQRRGFVAVNSTHMYPLIADNID